MLTSDKIQANFSIESTIFVNVSESGMPEAGNSPKSRMFIVAPVNCETGLYRLVSSESNGGKIIVLVPQIQGEESKPSILPEIRRVPQSAIIGSKCLLQIPEEGEAELTAQNTTDQASQAQDSPVSADQDEAEPTDQTATDSASQAQSTPVSADQDEAEPTDQKATDQASQAQDSPISSTQAEAEPTDQTATDPDSQAQDSPISSTQAEAELTDQTATDSASQAQSTPVSPKKFKKFKVKNTKGSTGKGKPESTGKTATDQASQAQSTPVSDAQANAKSKSKKARKTASQSQADTGSDQLEPEPTNQKDIGSKSQIEQMLRDMLATNEKVKAQPGLLDEQVAQLSERLVPEKAGKEKQEINADVNKGIRLGVKGMILMLLKKNKTLPKKRQYKDQEIADLLGCGLTLVKDVKKRLNECPNLTIKDLMEKKRGPERNPFKKISYFVYMHLFIAVHFTLPKDFDIPYNSWSAKAIKMFLSMYEVDVSLHYIYDFLAAVNLNSKVAKRVNPMKDQDRVNAFVTLTYYAVCLEAMLTGAMLIFGDETSVQQVGSMYGYAALGLRALASYFQSNRHTGKSYLIFLGPTGFMEVLTIDKSLDAEKFCGFLKAIKKKYPNQKFIIILDNCKVHHANLVTSWLNHWKAGKGLFRFIFLPAYAPEINPVERFNQVLKAFLRKFDFSKPEEVIEAANKFVDNFWLEALESPEKVVDLFRDEDCKYALELYQRAQAMPKELLEGAKGFIENFLQEATKDPKIFDNYRDENGSYSTDLFEKAVVEAASC